MEQPRIDPRDETRAALSDLLDRLTWLALTVGVLATVGGLFRISVTGWHVSVVTDQLFFVLLIVVLLLRRRLPVSVVTATIVGLATVTALTSFLSAGLGTMSFVTLTACCIITGAVFGTAVGIVYLAASVCAVGMIGYAICSGRIGDLLVTDPYLLEPQTWISQISGFAGFAAGALVVVGALQGRLTHALRKIGRQADELRRSESRYRLLAENMSDVLFFQNMELGVEYVSPSVEQVLGYTPDEALELTMADILTPDSFDRAMERFRHYAAMADSGRVEIPPMEYEYVRKDGTTFWGEVTPTFVFDDAGSLVGSQGLMRDISDRKRIEAERAELEQELHQADKLRSIGELAGGIAHDFNNQLAPIVAHADLLARGAVGPDDVAEQGRRILKPARNAADLTAKLLAFARKGGYERVPVDLHDSINEVAEILAHGIDKRIVIKRHFEAPSAVVSGDRTQLQNVLLNLGLNARDAMPDGGQIVFRTVREEADPTNPTGAASIVLTVSDTGSGMDENVRERAFEPFFTTKAPGKGTGMGLAAAYGAVARHGGTIDIESRQGRGTEVTVRLPALDAAVDGIQEAVPRGIAMPFGGRALVIDDEDGVREALAQLLENLDYRVTSFARAKEALDCFRNRGEGFDIVVLDLVLPDMGGREALAELTAIDPGVKVLLVSGYTADEEVLGLVRTGRVDFLEKPFQLADLAESLTRLSGASRLGDPDVVLPQP